MCILPSLFAVFRCAFRSRVTLELENVALRHQLNVLKRSVKRPRLTPADRYLWVVLARVWKNWRSALAIVRPETVVLGNSIYECSAQDQPIFRSSTSSLRGPEGSGGHPHRPDISEGTLLSVYPPLGSARPAPEKRALDESPIKSSMDPCAPYSSGVFHPLPETNSTPYPFGAPG
jgi:hypothetical protein